MSTSTDQLTALLDQIRTPGQPAWILLVPNSIGETVIVCSLVQAFRETHPGPIVLVIRPEHRAIAEMFAGTIADVVLLPMEMMREFTSSGLAASHRFEMDMPINTWPGQFGDGRLYALNEYWVRSGGRAGLDLIDLYRYLLRLPWDAALSRPVHDAKHLISAQQVVQQHGIEAGKAVVLFPGTNTNLPAPYTLWCELAEQYRQRGFRVFWNVYGAMFVPGEMPVPSCETISLPLEAAALVCEHAGTVVTNSSGMVYPMLAHGIRARVHVLLPEFSCRDYVNFTFEKQDPLTGCNRLLASEMVWNVGQFREWIQPLDQSSSSLKSLASAVVECRRSPLLVDDSFLKRLRQSKGD